MNLFERIKEMISHKDVLYSSSICSDCQKAEEFFKEHNIKIEIKKIEDPANRQELKEKHGRVLFQQLSWEMKNLLVLRVTRIKLKKNWD